jgi:hypothetical protein
MKLIALATGPIVLLAAVVAVMLLFRKPCLRKKQ